MGAGRSKGGAKIKMDHLCAGIMSKSISVGQLIGRACRVHLYDWTPVFCRPTWCPTWCHAVEGCRLQGLVGLRAQGRRVRRTTCYRRSLVLSVSHFQPWNGSGQKLCRTVYLVRVQAANEPTSETGRLASPPPPLPSSPFLPVGQRSRRGLTLEKQRKPSTLMWENTNVC